MANTNILIKRSTTTGRPSSLLAGEFAYSYSSNTLFMGSPTGNGVVNVGGVYYTQTLDAATSSNTASTLVKRDANGNFAGRLTGIADKADTLTNGRNFSISGHDITASAVGFDGSSAVVLDASLNAVPGLSAGTVGSTTQIPVITYGANGRILGVSTAGITTSFTVAGDTGSSQTISGGDTLTLTGGDGITSTASATDTVTFDVDNTVVRANTARTLQTIDSAVIITGNLTVQGTQFVTNTTTLNVADPLIYLAANNYYADSSDIGFAGNYYDGTNERHTGVFRNAGDKEYYIFDNYLPEISSNNEIDVANSSFRTANVNAGYVKATGVISAGINLNTYVQGAYDKANTAASDIVIMQGVNTTQNTRISGIEGVNVAQNTSISAADAKAQGAFDRANASVTSTSTLTSGQMIIGAGANTVTTVANVTYTLTGTLGASKTLTSLTVDAYGRTSAATAADIAIDASQITSGTLGVARGGTGLSTVTLNGITYGNGTSAVGVTAAAGAADQSWSNQILTTTNAGVPVWTTALDGGQF
jgi:hypothetical protein